MQTLPKLALATAPFLKHPQNTRWIMFQVVGALSLPVASAIWYFGLSAVLVTLTAIISCMATEWYFTRNQPGPSTLADGSALITGILLALTLPPGIALWMVALGGIVAIVIGKVIWGGLGHNIFNPALLGRAFLQAAFPTAITTWVPPDGRYFTIRGSNLALPFMKATPADAVTTATPLSLMKFQEQPTNIMDLFLGNTGGSLGETSALLLLLCGIWMLYKKVINWRIPAAIFMTVILFTSILRFVVPGCPSPLFMLFSGGLMLGAVFMATDMVTSPLTPKGCWIFGFGVGFITVLIRVFGGLPEGVMYAILLMNALTPLIKRIDKQRVFGT